MKILFLGAHTDDIEHGTGALFVKILKNKKYKSKYLSFSRCTDLERNLGILEESNSVAKYITQLGGEVEMLDLPNRRFFSQNEKIRKILEENRESFNPDIIFTHWEKDVHQDHQTIAEESNRVFKTQTLIGYECIRSCPSFVPNYFVEFSKREIESKIDLLSYYKTQQNLYYMDKVLTFSLASVRGAAIGKQYAEGYHLVKGIMRIC